MAGISGSRELIPAQPEHADWSFPTRIRVGPGRTRELAVACTESGIARPLVLTDPGIAGSGLLAGVLAALSADGGTGPVVHDRVTADPDAACVESGLEILRHHGCDGIVAVGGGSVLDAAKLIALAAGGADRLVDFADGTEAPPGANRVSALPVVALPTTAGTGSEVGRAAVLSDPGVAKTIIFHPSMLPRSVICDPLLTVGLPRHLTAATGMDALSHALEAWSSPRYHPAADGIAAESVRLALAALPIAVDEPEHLGARQQMMTAALLGATAFQKGLGAMHALSHPIGAMFGTHHGLTNAVLMPTVLRANLPAVEARLQRLAMWVGIEGDGEALIAAVTALRDRIGIPGTLAAIGVPLEGGAAVARAAVTDPSAATNPIPVTEEFAQSIFDRAWHDD